MNSDMDQPIDTMHTLSFYVANKPGVLSRIAQVFARRGFNIDSLVVSASGDDGRFSRMTVTASGQPESVDQILKQVSKLVDVIQATDHKHQNTIEREVVLIKVRSTVPERTEILQLMTHFKGRTLDFTDETMIIQVTGRTEKINSFLQLMSRYEVVEVVRTGKILMSRGPELT